MQRCAGGSSVRRPCPISGYLQSLPSSTPYFSFLLTSVLGGTGDGVMLPTQEMEMNLQPWHGPTLAAAHTGRDNQLVTVFSLSPLPYKS